MRCVTFDAHHSHNFVREVLLGQFYNISKADVSDIPFFRDLSWDPLPEHPCPHLPLQLCRHGEEFFGVLPGCCDLSALVSTSANALNFNQIQNGSKYIIYIKRIQNGIKWFCIFFGMFLPADRKPCS